MPNDELGLLRTLFDELPIGVVLLDDQGRVAHFNKTEERLAHRSAAAMLHRPFFEEVAPCMNIRELGGRFRADIGRQPLNIELELSFPFPFLDQPRDVRVRLSSFQQAGKSFGCLFVEDISARRSVERMKELLGQFVLHDLKNPLAVVLSNLDFLREDGKRAGELAVDAALGDARQAGARLQRMLLNLLDVTRLQTGEFPIARAPMDLAALLRETAAAHRVRGRERNVAVAGEALDEPATVSADRDILARALDNLLENAVRHSPPGKRVTVSLQRAPEALAIQIADQGPGVPDSMRESIFDPFVSASSRAAGSANRGLGLTFVRLAAQAHGGTVHVDCPPSGGSVFELRLPLSQAV